MFYTAGVSCFAPDTFQVFHSDMWLLVSALNNRNLHDLSAPFTFSLKGSFCLYLFHVSLEVGSHLSSSDSTVLLSLGPLSWPCLSGLQVCGIYLGGGEQAAFQHSGWPEPSCCCCVHTGLVLAPDATCQLNPQSPTAQLRHPGEGHTFEPLLGNQIPEKDLDGMISVSNRARHSGYEVCY